HCEVRGQGGEFDRSGMFRGCHECVSSFDISAIGSRGNLSRTCVGGGCVVVLLLVGRKNSTGCVLVVAGGERTLPAVGTFIRRRDALAEILVRVLVVLLGEGLALVLLLGFRGREESIAVSIRGGRVIEQAGANVIVGEILLCREILKQSGRRLAIGPEQKLSLKLNVFRTHFETLKIFLISGGDRG